MLRLLVAVHRWLGIAFSVVFFVWFASGIVMIYKRMPEASAFERFSRSQPLDPASIRITPVDAAARAGLRAPPWTIRLRTFAGRPAYQFLTRGVWTTIHADDGSAAPPLTPEQSIHTAQSMFPELAAFTRGHAVLTEPDQWTFSVGIRTTGPLHKVTFGDAEDTHIYISAVTGEVVMQTDRRSRFWGYAGAVLHWLYFTPLRLKSGLWSALIIYGSLLGCVLTASGLVIGIARFSMRRKFWRGTSRSPYAGWLKWHHYAGLVFGLFTFTWTFSGMLSMTPWNWTPGSAPAAGQVDAVRGGEIALPRFATDPALALTALGPGVREIDLVQFRGMPLYRADEPARVPGMRGRRRVVRADSREPALIDRFSDDDLIAAARAAMPGADVEEAIALNEYDAYYYDRANQRPLPVMRVKFTDPDRTWLYLDARDGTLLRREVTRTRLERWLYHGLHSLDFPGLYQSRVAWEMLVIVLSLGGLAASGTGIVIGARYLLRRS